MSSLNRVYDNKLALLYGQTNFIIWKVIKQHVDNRVVLLSYTIKMH